MNKKRYGLLIGTWCLLAITLAATQAEAQGEKDTPLTPATLETQLKRRGDKKHLAEQVQHWFGADNLKKGPYPKIAERTVAWAIEAPGLARDKEPSVVAEVWTKGNTMPPPTDKEPNLTSEQNTMTLPLRRLGDTNVYAAVQSFAEGTYVRYHYQVQGQEHGGGDLETYTAPPESKEQPGVPKGTVTQQPVWHSQVFAGTSRDWWVYVPAQYKPENPACVMVFQDGGGPKGYMPVVLDNMIAKGEIPVMVGIFINPGTFDDKRSNRSFEYDTLSDQYSQFLLTEILPEVEKTVKLRHDPQSRAVAGISSGGICAFTVAWERPSEFSKVLSWVGSFVNLQGGRSGIGGGHNYPVLIRKSKDQPKPIRVFLQDGANDLDNPFGNWPLANQSMAKALEYSGYDYKFVYGNGGHNDRMGRAILPDSLRWLWRGYKP